MNAALVGKIVVDATNLHAADFMSLTIGHTRSAGEQVAAALPGARIVKAFNNVFATVLGTPLSAGAMLFLPVAGDDGVGNKTVENRQADSMRLTRVR